MSKELYLGQTNQSINPGRARGSQGANRLLTLLADDPPPACTAHAAACHTDAVASALGVDALGRGDVTLGTLPAAVALTAPPAVLAVVTAQDRAGGWMTEIQAVTGHETLCRFSRHVHLKAEDYGVRLGCVSWC